MERDLILCVDNANQSVIYMCDVTWLISMRDMTHVYVWRWISSATWFYVWHIDDSGWRYWLPTRETGINSMCDATPFYVYKWMWSGTWFCRIIILCVTWLSHVSDMTDHPRMKRDPFLYEARLISMCAGGYRMRRDSMCDIHFYMRHDSFLCVRWM